MAGFCNPGIYLSARQMASLARLCPLCHLDLDLFCAYKIFACNAEPAGRHLLDGGAVFRAQALGLLASLAGIGASAQSVHGGSKAFVRLL